VKGQRAAGLIENKREDIVRLWLAKVRPLFSAEMIDTQIEDSLRLLIEELLQALRFHSGPLVQQEQSSLARTHGDQRRQLRVSLSTVIREYGLLLQAIHECTHNQPDGLTPDDLLEVSKHLFTAAAEAAEEFAKRQREQAERQDLEKFAFLAHELRNPLSSARVAWQEILRCQSLDDPFPPVISRSLDRISQGLDHSLVQIRLRSATLGNVLEQESLDVVQLLREAAEDADPTAAVKGVRIELCRESPPIRKGSHRLLRAALTNLLRNAVKFSRPAGSVEVRSRREKNRTLIEVADECGGIPPEKIEGLFDAFTQAGRDRSGFGLGLAIAKQAIEAHGGTLSVKNNPPRGCIFTVDLPSTNEVSSPL
jgi:signal transduction histidine kinase